MKAASAIAGVVTVFVIAPIWFYLLYQILSAINASELTWFLFWAYMPIAFLCQVILKIVEAK